MKRLWLLLTYLLTLSFLIYFIWYVRNTIDDQDFSSLNTISVWVSIFVAACLYALIIPFSGYAWSVLLRSFSQQWSPRSLSQIMAVTQIAKYIPGNVAQHIGRASMAISIGMKSSVLVASVLLETILAIVASMVVCLLLLSTTPALLQDLFTLYKSPILYAAAALVCISLLGVALLKVAAPVLRQSSFLAPIVNIQTSKFNLLIPLLIYCINYLVIGLGLWLIAINMNLEANPGYSLITAGFTVAWLIGFITPGAPAGIGVREAVLTLFLTNYAGQTQILALVLAIRLVTVLGDGICFCFGTAAIYWEKRNVSAT